MAQLMPLPSMSLASVKSRLVLPSWYRLEFTEFRVALPWELLYADDLAVIAETEEELIKRLNKWKENVESKGKRVNMNKTKVVISGERQMVWQKAARWPCGVCQKWVHKKCSGIKGSMSKVAKSFICSHCLSLQCFDAVGWAAGRASGL